MEKENETKTVVPALRFPEFQGMERWAKKQIKDLGEVITGNTPSKKEEEYWNGDFAWITAQDFKGKYINDSILKLTRCGKNKARVIPQNSVLVTCIASIGLNAINKVECSTNQQINTICCNRKYYYEYVYYLITYNAKRLKQLAGQTAVPIITKKNFEEFEVYTVENYDEQQKIADCLSSLDDLIEATDRKIEALKEHKKGLMQRLFPKEGENVPELRFPEFQGTKEWEEKKLTSLCDITNGKCNAQDHIEGGKYPLFDRSAVVKSSNDYLYDCEAIIIPGEGVKFVPKYYNGKFNLHQRAYALKDFSCNGKFLFYDMEYHSGLLAVKAVKSTVLSLRLPILQNFPLHIPFEDVEQQKIADCLSSLDELIEATSQKVEILKEHKKGLMQQLFPKI